MKWAFRRWVFGLEDVGAIVVTQDKRGTFAVECIADDFDGPGGRTVCPFADRADMRAMGELLIQLADEETDS